MALCVGSAASVTAVRDGPAADTAGDAGLRPALKRGAKYQRVGEAAGGCGADDPADSGLETERAEGRALRFAPEPIVHVLDAGGTSHRGQTTDWAARRARPGRRTAAERGAAAAARLAAELRATSARKAAAHAAARGLVLAEGLSGTGFPDPTRGSQLVLSGRHSTRRRMHGSRAARQMRSCWRSRRLWGCRLGCVPRRRLLSCAEGGACPAPRALLLVLLLPPLLLVLVRWCWCCCWSWCGGCCYWCCCWS